MTGVTIVETIREIWYVNEERAEDAFSALCSTHPARRHRTIHDAVEEDGKIFDAVERKTLKYYRVTVTVEEFPLETQI
jgi:hypothetical protein